MRSRLGAYIWDQRSNRGIKRTKLARMIQCEREAVVFLEDRGLDEENILPKLMEVLELDPKEIEERKAYDRQIRINWLGWCGQKRDPVIIAARKPMGCPVKVPKDIIAAGNEAVEAHAIAFAQKWNRNIELFVANHIRIIVSPKGVVEINELGYYEPWLVEKVEL